MKETLGSEPFLFAPWLPWGKQAATTQGSDEQPNHKHKTAAHAGTSEAILPVFLADCLRQQQNAPVSQMDPIIIPSPSENS